MSDIWTRLQDYRKSQGDLRIETTTFENSKTGACPARCVGDHATTQSECATSSSVNRFARQSYSMSLIVSTAST